MPSAIRAIITELGLRYAPSGGSDLHAAKVAFLTDDCANLDPRLLQVVVNQWKARSPYFPKISDILEGMRTVGARSETEAHDSKQRCIDDRNAYLASLPYDRERQECRWILSGGASRLISLADFNKRQEPNCTAEQAIQILREEGANSPILTSILRTIERREASTELAA